VKRPRRLWLDSRGFNLTEMLVVVAVLAIITTVGVPTFLSYWRAATLKGGAQELRTILNRARQVAVSGNTTVCVNQSVSNVQFIKGGGCSAATFCDSGSLPCVWRGPGTDGNGWFTLQNGMNVTSTTANVVFNFMGAATTGGVYTVQNPMDNATQTVTVSLPGRITIP